MSGRTNFPGLKAAGDTPDRVSLVFNQMLQGKFNNTFDVTLTPSSVATDVVDVRIGVTSAIDLMPTTANAATAKVNCYFDVRAGGVTIHHASSADVDQTFVGTILG